MESLRHYWSEGGRAGPCVKGVDFPCQHMGLAQWLVGEVLHRFLGHHDVLHLLLGYPPVELSVPPLVAELFPDMGNVTRDRERSHTRHGHTQPPLCSPLVLELHRGTPHTKILPSASASNAYRTT